MGLAETEQSTLKLWPNPTSGQVAIEVTAATAIEVFDIQGRKVAQYPLKSGNNHIDLENLPEGLYFIKGENGKVQKLLLMK